MSEISDQRSDEFLKISDQFQLGVLTTESSHPVTARVSEVARESISSGLKLLFDVDRDVLAKYREFAASGRAQSIAAIVADRLLTGGKVFFTGCGSTGRLSIQLVSIWRDFWQRQRTRGLARAEEFEHRAFSVMAGGDFALIKAVEGFEDFTDFGRKQIGDLGLAAGDIVFAITEGGETSFVIGTAWKGVEAGAKVFFVYNNPDEILCQHVQRSREVIEEPRIQKLNLTTGPMGITGSTRMQATTIQLAVLTTVLEMVVRQLLRRVDPNGPGALDPGNVPGQFLSALEATHASVSSGSIVDRLAGLVALEESVYRAKGKNNYFAQRFGIDVLTDTTERSPTYCTPAFRKFDDASATESWAFLFVPQAQTERAWESIIRRKPQCVEWADAEIQQLVPAEKVVRTTEIVRRISYPELMRFKVGLDGLPYRRLGAGDCAVGIVAESEAESLLSPAGFHRRQLEDAKSSGARRGVLCFTSEAGVARLREFVHAWQPDCAAVFVPVPQTDLLLDGVTRVAVKIVLNALSTCTMVRLGRVMGNYMIWVVASNLKLIDRATRYIQKLTDLGYREANRLLFEVIEYVEPRMRADQVYPPVVGLAVMRARHGLDNAAAEQRLAQELGPSKS